MTTLTENFIENLIIGVILTAIALAGAFFLREKLREVMTITTERVSRSVPGG